MTITFQCTECHKEVKAPDAAAGKRGKCPFCGHSVFIPAPVAEDDLIPLAPIDEEEERRRSENIRELFRRERDIIAETGSKPAPPLEQKEDLGAPDLHHYVVNYCLDMAEGKLQRADHTAEQLKKLGSPGKEAVDDFVQGRITEKALDSIPKPVLKAFLTQLKSKLA